MYGAAQSFAYAATRSEGARSRARRAFEALALPRRRHAGRRAQPARRVPGAEHPSQRADPIPTCRTAPKPTVVGSRVTRCGRSLRHAGRAAPTASGTGSPTPVRTNSTAITSSTRCTTTSSRATTPSGPRSRPWSAASPIICSRTTSRSSITTARPTRWGVFGPSALNASLSWADERGLNSLSMLTYLRIAHHVTNDARYDAAAQRHW